MGQAAVLDEGTAVGAITDDQASDFHALGLAGCIDKLTVPLRQGGVSVHWETPHHGVEIPVACAALLYQAAQETLNCAFKYSRATELTLRLTAVHHGVRLTITDNGVGSQSQLLGGREHGHGACLMTVAVYEAGGTLSIDSMPGKGTIVSISLPLD
ncbi:sensor histidine kinase [Arthrobacter oryzae]|uniref:sensor histidine kinase n=1 Tax=Arthrobacter oryzae TaxID=409290 RepID=UPI00278B0091|nr:ATP-binding protein [Arthrobacter oryzae]MDQ0079632.1 signal transduction histidine kinase [Arthrobacter oryzae]